MLAAPVRLPSLRKQGNAGGHAPSVAFNGRHNSPSVRAVRPRRQCRPSIAAVARCSLQRQQWPSQHRPLRTTEIACIATEQHVLAAPDLILTHPTTGARVHVFGVEHLDQQPYIGEWILDNTPSAVMVETACTPSHGAMPGNHINCSDQVPGTPGFFLRMFCGIAAQMNEKGIAAARQEAGGAWQQALENFNGEQLAYVAAFATGAALVFGDRPKDVTYRRLFTAPSLVQLDEAFSEQAASNYREVLQDCGECSSSGSNGGSSNGSQGAQQPPSTNVVDRIMLLEREAVMCKVLHDLCTGDLPQTPGTKHSSIVAVLGSAHLPGLQRLWQDGTWQGMVDAQQLPDSCLMGPAQLPPEVMSEPGAGAKRGLLEALLQLSVTQEVLDDLAQVLPPVPDAEQEGYQWTYEIYSSTRMTLAALPKELLPSVLGAVKGCDAWQLLQPLRDVRPVNGGPAWTEELIVQLRGLNFDLTGGQAEE